MISGHYQNIARIQARIIDARETAADPQASASAAHTARVKGDMLAKDERDLLTAIMEDVDYVSSIQELLNRMNQSAQGSVHRTLAIRHLEDAQSRLLRELGDKAD